MPRLSIAHLWPLAVLFAIFLFLSTQPIRPHDFWWHLRAGQDLLLSGRLPTTVDAFSFTAAGTPYENYAAYWLMEVMFYLLYSRGGLPAVIAVHALLITVSYVLLLRTCRGIGAGRRVTAAALLFAALLGFDDWNVRPQGMAFPAAALCLWAIHRQRQGGPRWLLAVFPMVALVWVNSHGSWPVLFMLLLIWLADVAWQAARARGHPETDPVKGGTAAARRARLARLAPPAVALCAASLACLANPRGLGAAAYVAAMSGNPVLRDLVPEWAPASVASRHGALFLAGLLFCAVLLVLSPRRPNAFQVLTFLGFGVLSLSTERGIAWFGLAMAPVVAEHLNALLSSIGLPERPFSPRWSSIGRFGARGGMAAANYALAAAMVIAALLALPWFKHFLPLPAARQALLSAETPVEATRWLLAERPPSILFHGPAFGSYLIWAAREPSPGSGQAYRVFVDTRLELYPAARWLDYLQISSAQPGWEERLAAYGVNTLMLSPDEQGALIAAARVSPGWRLAYEDQAAVIFIRSHDTRSKMESAPPTG